MSPLVPSPLITRTRLRLDIAANDNDLRQPENDVVRGSKIYETYVRLDPIPERNSTYRDCAVLEYILQEFCIKGRSGNPTRYAQFLGNLHLVL